MATQKRIKIIQEFVEKTEKRSREYAAISKKINKDLPDKVEKTLIELLKPEIAYSNKEVKEDYGHIDSNARLYIQCILTTFEKTEALLDTYYKDCLRYEMEYPDLISREIVDAVEELYLNYTRRTEPIKSILITLDAKLVREGAHVKVRGKTRRRHRTPSKSGSSSAPPLPNAHKILKNYRKKYNITKPHKKPEKQRYKNTIRNERRIRVGRAKPIYHPTVKALKEHRRLRPRSESELDHSSRHSPSPLGNYSPVRPIGAFKIPYEGTKNVEGMKPFGQSGVLPPVRRGTIRRASVHNDDE